MTSTRAKIDLMRAGYRVQVIGNCAWVFEGTKPYSVKPTEESIAAVLPELDAKTDIWQYGTRVFLLLN